MARHEKPTCPYCKRPADEIPETVAAAADNQESPSDFAMQDGTYNPDTNEFCCDEDYIRLGMPSSGAGWMAGDPIEE